MAGFVSKQPNGLYCRFSTVTDCPTAWNMTREDYINMKMQEAKEDAEDVLDNYLKPFDMVVDMQRVFQQHNIRAGKEKVEIDFPTEYNTELQCLKMSEENPYVDAYMAIIPGTTLAKIYRKYQQILLEKNVRTFLQFKGKVNKGIRKTLREEPDMFFSYNNGLINQKKIY